MTPYEVPLTPTPQKFTIALGGVQYSLTVRWCGPGPCWVMDLSTAEEVLLIGSIPLVPGTDLIGQYAYLGIAGALEVQSDLDLGAVPTFDSLGIAGHLYFLAD